jgi:Na+/phosphate symporter
MQEELNEEQERRCFHLKELVSDIERVSDLTEDMIGIVQREGNIGDILGKKTMAELDHMFQETQRVYQLALRAVRDGDREMAQLACSLEEEIDRMYWKARKKLSKRIKKGQIDAETADTIYVELMRSLERISDHADGLSMTVIRS